MKSARDVDDAHRAILRSLRVKTVIRENHGDAHTRAIEFSRCERTKNLFATIGGSTVTVYDDEHFGDHTAVVAQYVHEATEHERGGKITSMCWVTQSAEKENAATGGTTHEFGDAVLAIGDENGVISVISIAENRVVSRIDAHPGAAVRDMDGASARDGFVVSVGKDGFLKAWDVFGGEDGEGECVGTFDAQNACSVACDADGSSAVTGHSQGKVKRWNLSAGIEQLGESLTGFASTFTEGHAVECVRIVGDVLFAKTRAGRFETYDLAKNKALKQWTLPNASRRASTIKKLANDDDTPCRFGTSTNGKYVACGDSTHEGVVYVYDARTGEEISALQPLRVTGVVYAAAVVDHCRHVFASYGPAVVWRYEVIPSTADADAPDAVSAFEAAVK